MLICRMRNHCDIYVRLVKLGVKIGLRTYTERQKKNDFKTSPRQLLVCIFHFDLRWDPRVHFPSLLASPPAPLPLHKTSFSARWCPSSLFQLQLLFVFFCRVTSRSLVPYATARARLVHVCHQTWRWTDELSAIGRHVRFSPSVPLFPQVPKPFTLSCLNIYTFLNSKAADFLISYGAKKSPQKIPKRTGGHFNRSVPGEFTKNNQRDRFLHLHDYATLIYGSSAKGEQEALFEKMFPLYSAHLHLFVPPLLPVLFSLPWWSNTVSKASTHQSSST